MEPEENDIGLFLVIFQYHQPNLSTPIMTGGNWQILRIHWQDLSNQSKYPPVLISLLRFRRLYTNKIRLII